MSTTHKLLKNRLHAFWMVPVMIIAYPILFTWSACVGAASGVRDEWSCVMTDMENFKKGWVRR